MVFYQRCDISSETSIIRGCYFRPDGHSYTGRTFTLKNNINHIFSNISKFAHIKSRKYFNISTIYNN